MERKKVLITGANGFLGKKLCNDLKTKGILFNSILGASSRKKNACDFSKNFDLSHFLKETHTVVHCAGRVHVSEKNIKNKNLFYKINQEATEELARQAKDSGVKKFILISSAGVMGKITDFPNKFSIRNEPKPYNDYTLSKLNGEKALVSICRENKINYTILRPPLVYGPDAPGNWKKLVNLLHYNLPLPLKGIKNKRSFVFIDNLVDLIIECIHSKDAINKTFLVSDNHDMSTSEFIDKIIEASKNKNRLFFFDKKKLLFIARILGREITVEQLFNNMQLDISETIDQLNWKPRYTPEEGIRLSIKKSL
tara:strand:+ start:1433 stop:2362 length:930 start_codon:yes stop_codon:yes gene_type:complete